VRTSWPGFSLCSSVAGFADIFDAGKPIDLDLRSAADPRLHQPERDNSVGSASSLAQCELQNENRTAAFDCDYPVDHPLNAAG
jgi:hypothetical protein